MATTPTNKPIPSEDPRDLKFNAGKIDEEVNGSADYYADRFGVQRLTNTGRNHQFKNQMQQQADDWLSQLNQQESDFQQFLLNSGYQFLGDYENGPYTISARNQIIRYQNEFWRLNAATNPPYTTTGINSTSWTTDVTHLVSVGDAALRTELASINGATLSLSQVATAYGLDFSLGGVWHKGISSSVDNWWLYDNNVYTGIVGELPENPPANAYKIPPFAKRGFVSVMDFGAVGDGVTDDTVAFEKATAYCNELVNYVSPNPTISGNTVTLGIPAGRYVLKRAVDVSLGVRIVGAGQTQSVLLCDGNNALRLTPMINNGLFFPEIEHIGFKNTGNRSTAIYVSDGSQWFSKLRHIKIEGFDHGLRYQGDGVYYSGMAGSVLEDILMYNVNIGIGYYGTAAKNAWINETRFDTVRLNNALIGVYFKYVDGFEAVRFTNCSLNENSKKYSGTQDSNWVNGIRFQNCDVSNLTIDNTYFEKIDPKRASTPAEIAGIDSMTHVQIFDYSYQKNVDYYYNPNIIISVAEGSTDYYTCGRDMSNTGAICVINSNIRSLIVDSCSINLNEQILNWSSSAVPAYSNKIEFRNCHSAQQLLKASQAERAHFDVRLASSGSRCSLILGFNDLYSQDMNNKMVTSGLLEYLDLYDGTLSSQRSIKHDRRNVDSDRILYFDIASGRVNASGTATDPIKTAELFDVICYAKMGYVCYVNGTGALRFDYANQVVLVNRDINIILASTIDLQVNRPNVHSFIALYNSRVSITGGRLVCYTQDNDQPMATFLRVYDNNCEVRLQNMSIGYSGTLPAQPFMIISANGNYTVKLSLFGTTSSAGNPNYLAIDSAGMHFDYPVGYTYNLTNIKSNFFGA